MTAVKLMTCCSAD